MDLTSITERVPSPLNEYKRTTMSAEWGTEEVGLVPRGHELLLVIQPHEVGDEVEMVRVLAYGVLFSRIP